MSNPHKIVLIGFSSFERATFESFFRLAARRPPGYTLVTDAAQANLAVVNADDPATLRAAVANKPCQHIMLIGSSDAGTGWAIQKRPLNLMKVLTTVEQLLNSPGQASGFAPTQSPEPSVLAAPTALTTSTTPVAPTTPAAPLMSMRPPSAAFAAPRAVTPPVLTQPIQAQPLPAQSQPVPAFAPRAAGPVFLAPVSPTLPAAAAPRSTAHAQSAGVRASLPPPSQPAPLTPHAPHAPHARTSDVRLGAGDYAHSRAETPVFGAPTQPVPTEDDANVDYILVVDDSDIALKFMRNRLTRFGFRTDLANSGEEALGRMNVRPYKFVFLDVMMEGLDGYQTCRAIKQRKYAEGKPPVVVMLTSRGGTIDKIRGTLAGCDAYLTKPLNERDLIAILAKHDRTVARGFQQTNFGASAKSGFGGLSR